MRDNHPNMREPAPKITNKRLGRGRRTTGRVKDQVQPVAAAGALHRVHQPMNVGHGQIGPGRRSEQPRGRVQDSGPTGVLGQLLQVRATDNMVRVNAVFLGGLLDLAANLRPVRHGYARFLTGGATPSKLGSAAK